MIYAEEYQNAQKAKAHLDYIPTAPHWSRACVIWAAEELGMKHKYDSAKGADLFKASDSHRWTTEIDRGNTREEELFIKSLRTQIEIIEEYCHA